MKVKIIILCIVTLLILASSAFAQPDTFDWRNKDGSDWMTPVKNQGLCGSCWAFASVGVTEAQLNIDTNNPNLDLDLSEENLVSNCYPDDDCSGGSNKGALTYIRDDSITTESCFPYVDTGCPESCGCSHGCSNAECSDRCANWQNELYSIDHFVIVNNYENGSIREKIKNFLYETGPVTTQLRMAGYWDGDIYRCTYDTPVNHAVIIVGYDETNDYWIVKNSLGSSWNGDGYFKVGFDECGIETLFIHGTNSDCRDDDNDRYFGYDTNLCPSGTDCNDNDEYINPRMHEMTTHCTDGIDNDCDTLIDGDDPDCSEAPDGRQCLTDEECASNFCDNDGVGSSDDGYCFTPEDVYYENIDHQCEKSADPSISDLCDEFSGYIQSCSSYGESYFKDICSEDCLIYDDTDSFECIDRACSCDEPLCDGKSQGDEIGTCGYGITYFADVCSATADGEDAGDNICRSDLYEMSCTGDIECEGTVAGTNGCDSQCQYSGVFTVMDSGYHVLAFFDNNGDVYLDGTCSQQATCSPPDGSFVIKNVAYIDGQGNLCIETGDCSDQSASCNPSNDAFVVKDTNGNNIAYIDDTGDLCLTGQLFENT